MGNAVVPLSDSRVYSNHRDTCQYVVDYVSFAPSGGNGERQCHIGQAPSNDLWSMLNLFPLMAPSPRHSARKLSRSRSLLLALLCVVGTACGTTAQTGKIIFDDPRGTVSLQTIPDRSIQASHPIDLEPALLAQVLHGIEIQDQEYGIQKMLVGPLSSIPVFSDDQILFLAPLLVEGLRTAAPDQSVAYRVRVTRPGSAFESSTTETTAGSLYAYGRQLYMTLSQYRCDPIRANMPVSRGTMRAAPPDYSCLLDRALRFTPKAAQRSDSFDPPTLGKPTDRFLAIDYELLQQAWRNLEAKRHAAPLMESGPASVDESQEAVRAAEARAQTAEAQARAAEAQARNTEALAQEVETLKKQLESIQKQLGSQPTGQASPK